MVLSGKVIRWGWGHLSWFPPNCGIIWGNKDVIIRALKLEDGEYLPGNLIHPLLASGDIWWREIPPPDDVPPEAHKNKKHWFKSMKGQVVSIG